MGRVWYNKNNRPYSRYLCTRSSIDGIKAMSHGILGGKQVIKIVYHLPQIPGNAGRLGCKW